MTGPEAAGGPRALYVARAAEQVTAAQAIATATAGAVGLAAVGMLSSPTDYWTVRCDEGALSTADGPVPFDGVFALRLFSPTGELRWVHDVGGRGQAVLLSETAAAPAGWPSHRVNVAGTLDGRYALWGRRFVPHPDASGWCRALEGRLGNLDVPAALPEASLRPADERVRSDPWPAAYLELRTREYLGRDNDGNAFVREERLLEVVGAQVRFGRAVNGQ